MTRSQDNTQVQAALLRDDSGIDTPVKNSLCCAAAGIIASSSATAEALTPHEKLRGAALADATLNAQERPLAQPVVGYTHASSIRNALPESKVDRKYLPTDLTSARVDRDELIGQLADEIGRPGVCSAADRELFERVIDANYRKQVAA